MDIISIAILIMLFIVWSQQKELISKIMEKNKNRNKDGQ